ncbi:MAG: GNAT family N-acetyltransferase [Candidatus Hermodarchaeota archaeon]
MKNVEIIDEINQRGLFLRKISLDDINFVYESLNANEKTTTKFLSLGPIMSKDHAKKLIKNYLDYWKRQIQFNYVIEIRKKGNKKDTIKKTGSISLWGISWLHRRAEIGIWVNSKYWNQGIAKRALNLMKILSFNHLKLNRLEAHISFENYKSIQLFKKSGFTQECILKQYLNLRGKFTDAVVLAYINETQ